MHHIIVDIYATAVPDFLTMPIRDYLAAIVYKNTTKAQWYCGYFTGPLYEITRVSTDYVSIMLF